MSHGTRVEIVTGKYIGGILNEIRGESFDYEWELTGMLLNGYIDRSVDCERKINEPHVECV